MRSVVITGGCGFIGINLVKSILASGNAHILVLDNLSSGSKEDLYKLGPVTEVSLQDFKHDATSPGVTFLKADILDDHIAKEVCQHSGAVVHLAANAGVMPSIEDPRSDCLANVLGTLNYLDAARINGVPRFVFASSNAPLGEQCPPIHEEMVARPLSPYGASKLSGEAYCSAYYHAFGLQTVVLRFGNVYGPHSSRKNSVVAKFIKHILASEPLPIYGDGSQTRDFVYVDDLIHAILLALEKLEAGGHIFQIATYREHTVVEVAEELNGLAEKYLGRKSPIVYENERRGEVRKSYSDISKAKDLLEFEPRYDLKQGLEKTFLWFLENRG